jgi:hypothetical protein
VDKTNCSYQAALALGNKLTMKYPKYPLPDFLKGICSAKDYHSWLDSKAITHIYRDRKRGNKVATTSSYKQAIHKAVLEIGGKDAYTGKKLRWDLLHKYENTESKRGKREYKKLFRDLPTVDHVDDGLGEPNIKICAWYVNDAKHDLTLNEFLTLCEDVLRYNRKSFKNY